MEELLETDYLIVGGGLLGLGFADTMVAESTRDMIIVDRNARPGGHWNDAYPFVRLHLPSAFYGVGSRSLGSDRKLAAGPSAGLYENASAHDILSYFDELMQETLLPSGRVRYFPMATYQGDFVSEHRIVSLVSGESVRVRPRKLVDATTTDTKVPSTHGPAFPVAPSRRHMINDVVCRSDAELRAWMLRCRRNPGSHVAAAQAEAKDARWNSAAERMREHAELAVCKLRHFAEQLG